MRQLKKNLLIIVISIILSLAIGFFGGYEYRGYQIAKAFSDAFKGINSTNSNTTSTPTTTIAPQQKTVTVDTGVEGTLSTLKIKVNSVTEAQTIAPSYGQPAVAKQGTKFVIVSIQATNITNSSFAFPSDISLVDGKGRSFQVDPINYDPADTIVYRNMQPSIPETGTMAYMVPTDASGFSLQVIKDSTNELYKFIVK